MSQSTGVAAGPRPSRKCKRPASTVKLRPGPKKSPKMSCKSSCMIRREAWKNVLKYLPAKDQLTLSQVDPFIKQTLSAEGEITIDQMFLKEHQSIGELVPNLTLSCLKDGVDTIFSFFKNVRHLTMDQVKLGRIPKKWPNKIRTLHLYKCDTDTIETVLSSRSCGIKSLRVTFPDEIPKDLGIDLDSSDSFDEDDDNSDSSDDLEEDYTDCDSNDLEEDYTDNHSNDPGFESLTIECDEANCPLLNLFADWKSKTFILKCRKLVSLSDCIKDARKIIITAEVLHTLFTRSNILQHYELNVPRWNEYPDHTQVYATSRMLEGCCGTLETLILPACPESIDWLLPFDKLKELTIREPLRTKEEKALLEYLLEQKPKLILNYTISPNPVFNQIFRLNDDCLVKVFEKISEQDLFSIRSVHPRFQGIFRMSAKYIWKGKLNINSLHKYSAEYKMELLELLSPTIKELDAGCMSETKFLAILPDFPKLKKLEIRPSGNYCNIDSIKTFPHLQNLSLLSEVDPDYLDALLRHLNPTLIHFDYERFDSGFPAMPLRNLQSIGIPTEMLDSTLLRFWELNTQLTKLELFFSGISSRSNWETLAQLTNLKDLTILMEDREYEDYDRVLVKHFPNLRSLESFTVSTGYYVVLKAVLPRIGPELKSLEIYLSNSNFFTVTNDIQHMVNLERLCIRLDDYNVYESNHVRLENWQTLESVKYLTYEMNSTSSTLQIVKAMPNLKEMNNSNVKNNRPFLARLRVYLKKKKRTLLFNNEIFP